MVALTATTFTLRQGANLVSGTVANSADGRIATLTPAALLPATTVFTATITTGARSTAGGALAADHTWTFTTGAAADMSAPFVTATNPRADHTGIAVNTTISATFSEPMDPLSISNNSFTLRNGNAPVAGSVTYGPGFNATFTPSAALPNGTLITATIGTGVRDLQNNALGAAYSWSFTTGNAAARGPAPVLLGAAGNYVIVAKAAISTVPDSVLTGNIAVSPAAATYITGFSLVADPTNVFSTSPQVVGQVFAANYAVPTPENLTTAVGNMESAYTDAAGRTTPDFLEYQTGSIGGLTLEPGLYKWTSTINALSNVTISGGANDVWIFQTTGDLIMAANARINLQGGAQAKNIFWQIAGHATFGAGAHFEGIILCITDVTLQTGASMNGRILAQTEVVLQQATVTVPAQ